MLSAPSTIYTGFWTNWSYGPVYGSTLTLSAQTSAFLIAFIALWVKFAGGQLWSIITFLASNTRSTSVPQDGLYHQQQAILRNTSQPLSVSWSMLKLSWFWKSSAKKAVTRTLIFVVASLAFVAAFGVAGILSSRISSTDSEVLLVPEACGNWPYPYLSQFNPATDSIQDYEVEYIQYATNFNQLAQKSHVYVSECYNSGPNNQSEACLPYGRSRIAWSTNNRTACPFDEDMCIADAVQFDSGFLDSQTHLGINTRDNRIQYRRVMTCAPITTEGYVSGYVNISELNIKPDFAIGIADGDAWLKYSYGQNVVFTDNTTFAFSNLSWDYSQGYWLPYRMFDLE